MEKKGKGKERRGHSHAFKEKTSLSPVLKETQITARVIMEAWRRHEEEGYVCVCPCMCAYAGGGGRGSGEWSKGRKEVSPPATSLTRIQS